MKKTIIGVFIIAVILISPVVSKADTQSDTASIIASLQAQIVSLTNQLNALIAKLNNNTNPVPQGAYNLTSSASYPVPVTSVHIQYDVKFDSSKVDPASVALKLYCPTGVSAIVSGTTEIGDVCSAYSIPMASLPGAIDPNGDFRLNLDFYNKTTSTQTIGATALVNGTAQDKDAFNLQPTGTTNITPIVPGSIKYDMPITSPYTDYNWSFGDTTKIINWTYPTDLAGKTIQLTATLTDPGQSSGWTFYSSPVTVANPSLGQGLQAGIPWTTLSDKFSANSVPVGPYNIILSADDASTGISHRGLSGQFNIVSTSTLGQPSITVISPNGGENFVGKKTIDVKWSSQNLSNLNVSIDLVSNAGYIVNLVSNIKNTGSYTVSLPSDLKEGQYKIIVSTFDKGPSAQDYSDNYFTTSPAPYDPSYILKTVNTAPYMTTGSSVTLNWSVLGRDGHTKDWVGLYKRDDPNTKFISWQYTGGTTSGTFTTTLPTVAGPYDFRYLLDNGYTDTARSSVTVLDPLKVSCSGIVNSDTQSINWGSQISGGAEPYQFSWSAVTDAPTQVPVANTLGPGLLVPYSTMGGLKQATVKVTDISGKPVSATCSATLASKEGNQTYTLTTYPASATPGSQISVTWSAPSSRSGHVKDWVSLYKAGDPNTKFISWQYTGGATSGTFTTTAPSTVGSYEFRYLTDNGYTDVARTGISVSVPVTNLPVNGVCGSTINSCTVGVTLNSLDSLLSHSTYGSTVSWTCAGSNGGSGATCHSINTNLSIGGNNSVGSGATISATPTPPSVNNSTIGTPPVASPSIGQCYVTSTVKYPACCNINNDSKSKSIWQLASTGNWSKFTMSCGDYPGYTITPSSTITPPALNTISLNQDNTPTQTASAYDSIKSILDQISNTLNFLR